MNRCERCNTTKLPEGNTACGFGHDCISCVDCTCADCHNCLCKHCFCTNNSNNSTSDDSENI